MRIDSIVRWLLYFSFFMMPQGASLGAFSLGGWSVTSFRLSYFAIIVLFMLLALYGRKIRLTRRNNLYSFKFYIFWIIYAVCTIPLVQDISNWIRQLVYVITGFLGLVFSVALLRDKNDIVSAFKAMQLGIVVQIVFGMLDVFGKVYYFGKDQDQIATYSRYDFGLPLGSQGNVNDFATLMYIGVILSMICFYHSKYLWRWLYAGCFISELFLIAMSGSRANYYGIILALGCMLFLLGSKQKLYFLVATGVVLCLAIGFLTFTGIDILEIIDKNVVVYSEGSDNVRVGLIMNGFYFLLRTGGLGVGPGQIESWMATESIFYRGDILNMHNYWMEIMTSYGFTVFIGFMIFYYKLWRNMKVEASRYRTIADKIMPLSIAAMMVGWVIASVSPSSVIKYDWLWAFWAICIAYQGMLGERKEYGHTA